jgi:hypothetical protein
MVDRPAEQVEAGLLFLALELDPEHRTLAELTQRMSANDPHRREKEAGAVDQAAASLGDRTRKTTVRAPHDRTAHTATRCGAFSTGRIRPGGRWRSASGTAARPPSTARPM